MLASWAERLLQLQKIDMEIRAMKTRLKLIPTEIENLSRRMKEAAAATEAAGKKVSDAELSLRKAEGAIAAAEERIRKLKQQSAMVKKNSEYQAMLAEIEQCRGSIGTLEGTVLETMDEIEAARAEYKTVSRERSAEIAACRQEMLDLRDAAKEFASEIAAGSEKRKLIRPMINGELLRRYEQLEKTGSGLPAAEVGEDGICGNCRLQVTTQDLYDLKAGKICYCGNCMHIIYSRNVEES